MSRTVEDLGFQQWILLTASGELIKCGAEEQANALADKIDENVGIYNLYQLSLTQT